MQPAQRNGRIRSYNLVSSNLVEPLARAASENPLGETTIDAIIFDCDGTLADTMPVHYEAWQETMSDYGLFLSEDRFYELGGWPTLVNLCQMLVLKRPVGSWPIRRQRSPGGELAFVRRWLHNRSAWSIEPVVRVVRQYRGKLPIAVATGAVRPILDQILGSHFLAHWPDAFDAGK